VGVKKGLSVLNFIQPLLGVGKEAFGVGPGLIQEVLSHPLCLLSSQGWVGRPDGGGDPLARFEDNLHGLMVCPSQDPPRRLPRTHEDFFGLLDRAGADLLRLLPRLLAAFGRALV
jgi:hypothetical protein